MLIHRLGHLVHAYCYHRPCDQSDLPINYDAAARLARLSSRVAAALVTSTRRRRGTRVTFSASTSDAPAGAPRAPARAPPTADGRAPGPGAGGDSNHVPRLFLSMLDPPPGNGSGRGPNTGAWRHMKQGTSHPPGMGIAARGARLSYAMRHRGFNKLSVLAHHLGVTESAVSRWRGQGNMTVNNIIAVCDVLDVSADWLLLGRGAMEWRGAVPGEEDGFEPWLHQLPPDVRRLMLELVRRLVRQPGAPRTIG